MSNLMDLNEILFKHIEALDGDMTDEEFERQCKKSDEVVKVAGAILNNAKLALDAQKHFDEYGMERTVDIPLLGISNEGLAIENKNLRRRLAKRETYDC